MPCSRPVGARCTAVLMLMFMFMLMLMFMLMQLHVPCLLQESVEHMLLPHMWQSDGTFDGKYVDCTSGRR